MSGHLFVFAGKKKESDIIFSSFQLMVKPEIVKMQKWQFSTDEFYCQKERESKRENYPSKLETEEGEKRDK